MPTGHFGIRAGGIMAATDRFYIDIAGQGGHAARPQTTIDPIIVAANMIVGMQAIVSRNVDPLASAVLSVAKERLEIAVESLEKLVDFDDVVD